MFLPSPSCWVFPIVSLSSQRVQSTQQQIHHQVEMSIEQKKSLQILVARCQSIKDRRQVHSIVFSRSPRWRESTRGLNRAYGMGKSKQNSDWGEKLQCSGNLLKSRSILKRWWWLQSECGYWKSLKAAKDSWRQKINWRIQIVDGKNHARSWSIISWMRHCCGFETFKSMEFLCVHNISLSRHSLFCGFLNDRPISLRRA